MNTETINSFEMIIDAPPFSVNNAYYLKSFSGRSATKIRTAECRAWGDSVLVQLQKYLEPISQFKAGFNPSTDAIAISLVFYIPEAKFYTKEMKVSLRSNDLTNVEKLLVDILFDVRFNDREVGDFKIKNLNIDDKLIVNLESKKRPTPDDHYIVVNVSRISNRFEGEDDE